MENQPLALDIADLNEVVLDTQPAMTVADVLSRTDGVYFCIKNHDSVFLWVNENFAQLVGQTPQQIIGTRDSRAAHVAHDQQVMASGVPLLNFHETIQVPNPDGSYSDLEIVTQKGLLRKKGGTDIIGITVCFSKRFPEPQQEVQALISHFGMKPTGVGGYLAQGPKGDFSLSQGALPDRFSGERAIYSTNLFLLSAGEVLRLHTLDQDEQWFFHQGSAIQLHAFSDEGIYSTFVLGSDLDQGQCLHGVARHGQWFGAELLGSGYALVSCSLAPAWTASDSHQPSPVAIEALTTRFPQQSTIIDRLR
ncbi:cupin domain-containing protein [Hymenobacter rigui]|uniref:PAS domain-containing protein n=1 Tax=Hymenobacter rigui TaxID=334424 RepID=A0A428K9Q7_9BACT|nr:cupin domain-containing protein [Hymenobacter rigui]RSK43175.1 hypothetical protein EI291_22210 [Hymenobacter rigui]